MSRVQQGVTPDGDRVAITWEAYAGESAGVGPMMFGGPSPVRVLIEAGRNVGEGDLHRDLDLVVTVGNVPGLDDPEQHVANVQRLIALAAKVIAEHADLCAASAREGIESRRADIALVKAEREHKAGTAGER